MSAKESPDFGYLMEILGIQFANPDLLRQACTHRSYLNEHPESRLSHNERLEFLGDAVVELITTEFLFNRYPDKTEGDLTAYRAALVNTESLAAVAAEIKLEDFLLLSRGESLTNGRSRQAILANTFEAVVGAVFCDRGYAEARRLLEQRLLPRLRAIIEGRLWSDPKSFLQERAQAEKNVTPVYQVLSEIGPDHDKIFTVGVYFGDRRVGEGRGPSKQKAEQEAAGQALKRFGWNGHET